MLFDEVFEMFNRYARAQGMSVRVEWYISPVDSDYEYRATIIGGDEDYVTFEGIDGFNVSALHNGARRRTTHNPTREEVEDALVANFGRLF